VFCMNKFTYEYVIDGRNYEFCVDSSKDDNKIITVNGHLALQEKYTLSLNREAYIIYYPIKIGEHEVVISIDDTGIIHEYNIFLDGISGISGKPLNLEYETSESHLTRGIKAFIKNNWLKVLLDYFLSIFGMVLVAAFAIGYSDKEITIRLLLSLVVIPVLLPVLLLVEWKHNVNIVKKFSRCFRPKVIIDAGEGYFKILKAEENSSNL